MAAKTNPNRKKKANTGKVKQPKQTAVPKFAAGERTLPQRVDTTIAVTSKDGRGQALIPVPKKQDDFPDVTTVGWVFHCTFAVKDKYMFASATQRGLTATMRIRAEDRDNDHKIVVVGETEEKAVVVFTITPYYVTQSTMTMGK
eukprot:153669_1